MSANANLTTVLNTAIAAVPTGALGVAVSGGGDSVALLRLLNDWGQEQGRKVYAATVNHNLRPEAADEATFVAGLCRDLGVPHQIFSWDNWDGQGNLQNAARNVRRDLLTGWAQELGLTAVCLGHTQDDQAETFLMRLARGSGVDGLSGILPISGNDPIWLRPLLDVPRKVLRNYLTDLGQGWIEDPSNLDEKYDRVKMRNAMPVLAELGLTTERLAMTAKGLQPARLALEKATKEAARSCSSPDRFGTIEIDLEALRTKPLDIQFRLLSRAMAWVTGAAYRPRFIALKAVYELLQQGKSQTLAGCYIKAMPNKHLIVMREMAAMTTGSVENGRFDGRWQVYADASLKDVDIRPLGGKGLLQLENWRDLGILRDILLQTPAAWQGDIMISAPLAGFDGPVRISLEIDPNQFY